ncbi:hypothetical protein KIN20_001646 [Parelaphostrongylus tenuis]|uniref:Uncharacterized protein n=1 Tax=Parelaphostrongylus tenuis TaxID=148309 RepID=A0AAD5QET0_PARTN|nr:hypothetical protein KIN20_001646 [Parelaphostrongylus tenuis]
MTPYGKRAPARVNSLRTPCKGGYESNTCRIYFHESWLSPRSKIREGFLVYGNSPLVSIKAALEFSMLMENSGHSTSLATFYAIRTVSLPYIFYVVVETSCTAP